MLDIRKIINVAINKYYKSIVYINRYNSLTIEIFNLPDKFNPLK